MGGCRAESGRGKLPAPPGQESEKRGCIRGLRQSRGQMSSCPGPRSHVTTASLGTPCSARLPLGLGRPVSGDGRGLLRAPPKPSRSQTPPRPAHGPCSPASHGHMPLNVDTNRLLSRKHTCEKTLWRHRKRKGRGTCGVAEVPANRDTVTQSGVVTAWPTQLPGGYSWEPAPRFLLPRGTRVSGAERGALPPTSWGLQQKPRKDLTAGRCRCAAHVPAGDGAQGLCTPRSEGKLCFLEARTKHVVKTRPGKRLARVPRGASSSGQIHARDVSRGPTKRQPHGMRVNGGGLAFGERAS